MNVYECCNLRKRQDKDKKLKRPYQIKCLQTYTLHAPIAMGYS